MTTQIQAIPDELIEVQRLKADLEYDQWKTSPARQQAEIDLSQRREAGLAPYPSGYRSIP